MVPSGKAILAAIFSLNGILGLPTAADCFHSSTNFTVSTTYRYRTLSGIDCAPGSIAVQNWSVVTGWLQ